MSNQDFSKEFNYHLSSEFKKIDELLFEFQSKFVYEIFKITKERLINIRDENDAQESILSYSFEIFSCAESVLDKDKNYSDLRLKEELDSMTIAVNKTSQLREIKDYAEQTHLKAKEIMVAFFPDLVDLSANGFRLLEKYCVLYNRDFVATVASQIEKKTDFD